MLKAKYNSTLERFYNGYRYMDNELIPLEERMKHFDNFKGIVDELNQLLTQIPHTEDDVLYGFGEGIYKIRT